MNNEVKQNVTAGNTALRWSLGLLLGLCAGIPATQAQTTTWNGAVDSSWFNAGNWSSGVPTAGDTAIFNNPNNPLATAIIQGNTAAEANELAINSGRVFVGSSASGILNIGTTISVGPSGTFQLINGSTVSFNSLHIEIGGTYLDTLDDHLILTGSNPQISVASGTVTINSQIDGTEGLIKASPGTLILANDNIYTGGTTINGGTLQVGNGGTTGSLGSGDVVNHGTLTFNRSDDITFDGTISGSGNLGKAGFGKLTLTADNSYAGSTTISGGTLQVGDGGTTGSLGTGSVTNNGTLAIFRSDDITLANDISGFGNFQQLGSNTITLTGNNTYTGTTTISSNGAIRVGNGGTTGSLGSGAIINNGGLTFDRSDTLTVSNGISGMGSITNAGGTTVLLGNNSFIGDTVIEAGTLQIGNGGNTGSLASTNIINDGALVFNRSNAVTVAGTISGSGSFSHSGSGTLTLTGTNTYTGGTTIDGGGILRIRNEFAIGNGDLNLINGRLGAEESLTRGLHLDLNGNYVQGADGILEIGIGGQQLTSNRFDHITVSGTATLDGTLHLTAFGGYQGRFGDLFDIIVATNGLSGTFSELTNDISHSILIKPVLTYSPTAVTLGWEHLSFVSYLASSNINLKPNQLAVATGLDTLLTSTDTNDVALINQLDRVNEFDIEDLPFAFDLISPEELSAMVIGTFAAMDAQGNQFLKRANDLQSDYRRRYHETLGNRTRNKEAFNNYVNRPWDIYFELPFNSVSVGSDANASGYDLSANGFTLGADRRISDRIIVGGAFNYLSTGGDLAYGGEMDIDTVAAQIYATWFSSSGLHFEGMLGGSINSYDTKRTTLGNTPSGFETASGDTDGVGFTMLFSGGYNWERGPWEFGPSLSFQYMHVSIDGFTETGSSAPMRIDSLSEDAFHTQLAFALRYRYQVPDSWTFITPEIQFAWRHDFGDDTIALNSLFASGAGGAFTVSGPELGSDSILVSLGCSVQWKPSLNTYLNYTLQRGRSGYDSGFLNLGLRYSF